MRGLVGLGLAAVAIAGVLIVRAQGHDDEATKPTPPAEVPQEADRGAAELTRPRVAPPVRRVPVPVPPAADAPSPQAPTPEAPSAASPTPSTAPTPGATLPADEGDEETRLTAEANQLMKGGDYETAAAQSVELLERYPKSRELRYIAVYSLCAMGDNETAKELIAGQQGPLRRQGLRDKCSSVGGDPY